MLIYSVSGILEVHIEFTRTCCSQVYKSVVAGSSRQAVTTQPGHNPTGGGVGDTPSMLESLLAAGVGDAVVQGPVDAAAVDACIAAGVGANVSLTIGGKLDHLNASPLAVEATVFSVSAEETQYEVDLMSGTDNAPSWRTNVMPPAAVIAVSPAGSQNAPPNLVTLTSARKPFHYEASFAQLGITVAEHPILVVKM